MGADHVINGSTQDVALEVGKLAPGGADVVFECTGIGECIDPAVQLCKPFGTLVWQGNYGSAPISMNFLPPHGKRLKMFFPSDDGMALCRRAVVRNMAMGALKWEKTITHRIDCAEAPDIYTRINCGDTADIAGVVISWLTYPLARRG